MKIINTKLHGMLDYMAGTVLLIPWITMFHERGNDTVFLTILGTATIFMSLLTNYELSLIKLIPMKVHLVFDVLSALLLIATPWIFSVEHYQLYWPTLLGMGELLVVILSRSTPYHLTRQDLDITRP